MEVGYDPATSTLEVVFHGNPDVVYSYHKVPQEIYDGLMSADSVGGYFNRNVRSRPHMFPYERNTR
jgi:hypothetical protein